MKLMILMMLMGCLGLFNAGATVSINGREVNVVQFKDYSYVEVYDKVPFQVTLSGLAKESSIDVSPHSREVAVSKRGDTATFSIDREGYYMVSYEGERFFIFAEEHPKKPEGGVEVKSFPGVKADGRTNITKALQRAIDESALSEYQLIVSPGIYLCDALTIPTGSNIYLEKGAVIKADPNYVYEGDSPRCNGFITVDNAEDVRISGAGAIDGGGAVIRSRRAGTRLLLVRNSKNVTIDGIKLQDPSFWNTHILGSENVSFKRVKLLCDRNVKNTDGFDPDGSRNILIDKCFAHCADDAIAIKSTGHCGLLRDVEDIMVSNCVFVTKKSALKVGTETKAASMSGIRFLNNDVLECDRGISLYVADGTNLHDVVYTDNTFEKNYPDTLMMPFHFYARKRTPKSDIGRIYDVRIVNNSFETQFPCPPVAECLDGGTIDIEFSGLKINGKEIKREEQINIVKTTSNIIYK